MRRFHKTDLTEKKGSLVSLKRNVAWSRHKETAPKTGHQMGNLDLELTKHVDT